MAGNTPHCITSNTHSNKVTVQSHSYTSDHGIKTYMHDLNYHISLICFSINMVSSFILFFHYCPSLHWRWQFGLHSINFLLTIRNADLSTLLFWATSWVYYRTTTLTVWPLWWMAIKNHTMDQMDFLFQHSNDCIQYHIKPPEMRWSTLLQQWTIRGIVQHITWQRQRRWVWLCCRGSHWAFCAKEEHSFWVNHV